MKEKKLKIWVCEDDESVREAQKETIEDEFPGCKLTHFENAGFAIEATGSPDFIIVDVGGAMSLGCNITALTRCNVEGLAELHPGAIFIIFSAIGALAEEVYEELKQDVQACTVWFDGCDFHSTLGDEMRKWL